MTKPLSCFLHSRTVSQICLCICIPASIKAAPRLPSKSRILGTFEHIRTPSPFPPLLPAKLPQRSLRSHKKQRGAPRRKRSWAQGTTEASFPSLPFLQVPVSESGAAMRKISGPGFFRVLFPSFFSAGGEKGSFFFSKFQETKELRFCFTVWYKRDFGAYFLLLTLLFFETSKKTDG